MNSQIIGIRRRFFITSLAKYMLMLLVPIISLSSVIGWVLNNQVPSMVREHSESLFAVSSLSLDTLFKELLQPKIFIEANPEMHISLLQYLEQEATDEKTKQNMLRLSHYLDTTRVSRNYIHSMYIAKEGAPYMLMNGERIRFLQMLDNSWLNQYLTLPEDNFYIFQRNLRAYSFEKEGIPVITLIYVTKYHELLVINLFHSYFSHFLQSLTQYDNEAIWVSDGKGSILSENWTATLIPEQVKMKAFAYGENHSDFENNYQLTMKQLDNGALILYSLIPKAVLNASSIIILRITVISVLLAIFVSFILSLVFTRKSYLQINKIVELFEQNLQHPISPIDLKISDTQRDPFYYILEQVISLYVNQAHLHADLLQNSYQLIRARLAALQYQINPHFIFNTLQMIDIQISKDVSNSKLANHMIQEFSRLLRYSLEDPTTLVPLSQEIEMTKTFIKLFQYRNTGALQVFWYYEDEAIESVNSIRMLFQPLIENVISHSISKLDSRPITVRIRLAPRNEYLLCSVIDNGCGVSAERLEQIRKRIDESNCELQNQIGLVNVNTRLSLSFSMASALKIYSKPEHGFAIFFSIPYAQTSGNSVRMENDTF